MAIKNRYVYYQARNNRTGLTDVTANIYKEANGADVAVATGLALAEVSAANAPGVYALELTAAQLTGFGGKGVYSAYINSATRNAPAVAKFEVFVNDNDDLEAILVSIESKVDTVLSNQATAQADISSIKTTVESTNTTVTDVNVGNANLKALLDQAIASIQSVQNNTKFVAVIPPQIEIPDSGTNRVQVPIRIFNTQGDLEDPDTQQVQVSAKNEAGLDRSNYIVGFTSGPVDATRTSKGVYVIDLDIPDSAGAEQLILEFDYVENSIPLNYPRTAELVPAALASGFALQSTLLDVLTDTSDMQPRVVAIESILNDGTVGLAALKALIDIIDGVVDDTNAKVNDATFGLASLKTILDTKASQLSVDALNTILTNDVKGAGFDQAEDTLHEISLRTFSGGRAV
jgi:hypothetical protein